MYLLLDEARRLGQRPLVVFAGAATQVGLVESLPVDEGVQDRPITAYDLHKLHAEQLLLYYHRVRAVDGVSLRLANIYGPGPVSSATDRGVLNLMANRALRGEDLTIYGDGEFTRDYLFIDDAIAAFLAVIASGSAAAGRYYVTGTGIGHTVGSAIRLVGAIAAARGAPASRVVHVPMPTDASPIEHRNFVADPRALQNSTGWLPRFTLEAGLTRTLDAFSEGTR